ncbi:hypothetical protein S83_070361, partial [Arachis hypogaea]
KPEKQKGSLLSSLQTRNPIAATFKLQNTCQPPPLSLPTLTTLSKVCSTLSKVKLVVVVGPELQIFVCRCLQTRNPIAATFNSFVDFSHRCRS